MIAAARSEERRRAPLEALPARAAEHLIAPAILLDDDAAMGAGPDVVMTSVLQVHSLGVRDAGLHAGGDGLFCSVGGILDCLRLSGREFCSSLPMSERAAVGEEAFQQRRAYGA